MALEVSPTGLNAFDNYVSEIQRVFNTMPIRVTTQISFDPNKTYPTLLFDKPTLHDNLATMMALREKGQILLHREPEPLPDKDK